MAIGGMPIRSVCVLLTWYQLNEVLLKVSQVRRHAHLAASVNDIDGKS